VGRLSAAKKVSVNGELLCSWRQAKCSTAVPAVEAHPNVGCELLDAGMCSCDFLLLTAITLVLATSSCDVGSAIEVHLQCPKLLRIVWRCHLRICKHITERERVGMISKTRGRSLGNVTLRIQDRLFASYEPYGITLLYGCILPSDNSQTMLRLLAAVCCCLALDRLDTGADGKREAKMCAQCVDTASFTSSITRRGTIAQAADEEKIDILAAHRATISIRKVQFWVCLVPVCRVIKAADQSWLGWD
jgi:hypothetical protein